MKIAVILLGDINFVPVTLFELLIGKHSQCFWLVGGLHTARPMSLFAQYLMFRISDVPKIKGSL